MSDEIQLTTSPVVLSGAGDHILPLDQSVDVGEYYELDLILHVFTLQGTAPTAEVQIFTSMQKEVDEQFAPVVSFTQVTSGNKYEIKNVRPIAKYVRYVVTLGGTQPEACIWLRGMARRRS
jgi:hypothetical protein